MRSVATTTDNRLSTKPPFDLPVFVYHVGKISKPFLSDIAGELLLKSGEIQRCTSANMVAYVIAAVGISSSVFIISWNSTCALNFNIGSEGAKISFCPR